MTASSNIIVWGRNQHAYYKSHITQLYIIMPNTFIIIIYDLCCIVVSKLTFSVLAAV